LSGSVFTMRTGISYFFMLIFNMFLQITCCSGSELALIAWISYSCLDSTCFSCLNSMCFFRLLAWVATYSQWLQRYLTPSCLFSICFLRCHAWVAAYSQWEQVYLTPSCLDSICFFRLPAVVAAYSHLSHWYLAT